MLASFVAKIKQQRGFVIIAAIFFILLFILNLLALLSSDDYYIPYSAQGKNIFGVINFIAQHAYSYYMTWQGRIQGQIFTDVFLLMPKPLFDALNSLVFITLGFLIYKHCIAKKNSSPWLYLIFCVSMWLFLPVLRDTFFWVTGSAAYLWPDLFIFGFLLIYRNYLDKQNTQYPIVAAIVIFVLGFLAGWAQENTSGAVILGAILFMVLYKFVWRIKLPMWAITGLVGAIIGYSFMILAPGNAVRIHAFPPPSFETYGERIFFASRRFSQEFLPFTIAFPILYSISLLQKVTVKRVLLPLLYLSLAVAADYALVLAPSAPPRAVFGAAIFFLIACGTALNNIEFSLLKKVYIVAGALALTMFFANYTLTLLDFGYTRYKTIQRIKYIEEQKLKGNFDVQVPIIYARNKYNSIYAGGDIENDANSAVNKNYARLYGLKSILGIPDPNEEAKRISKDKTY